MIALIGAVLGGATTGFLRLQAELRAQFPGILQSRLEAALHRKVEVGTIHLTPFGISVEGLRVLRTAGDREEPLVAKRLNVGIDWWGLVSDRQWRISGVEAVDARFRVTQRPARAADKPWTQQLLALSDTGIERFRVRNASLSLLPPSGPATWSASGVTGELVLGSRQFHYNARLKGLQAPEVQLAALHLAGTRDRDGVTLKEGAATFQGAAIRANGRLKSQRNEALVTLQVDHLPLNRLATRLGIPADWAMQGSLTGEVTVDARDNALQSIQGKVEVARGSLVRDGGELPWKSAQARVDWTPARTQLSEVRVLGNNLTLTANGDVTLQPGRPFTAGEFRINGELNASHPAAVAQVADLLAFRQLLDGRWAAEGAVVRFQSRGTVGQIARANSSGHLHVDGLTFRPVAGSDAVTVQHLDADLERTSERLAFSEVRAQTDGLSVVGDAQLADAHGGRPAEFLASGSVEVDDLKSLRKAVPEATLWRWVPEMSPTAKGRLQFRLGGPVGSANSLWSDGRFEFRDVRLAAHAPLPNGVPFSVPVDVASGNFRHAYQRLEVEKLSLSTKSFQTDGNLTVDFAVAQPTLVSDLRVHAANWRDLPAVPTSVLPGLSGGPAEGALHITGRLTDLTQSEVTGQIGLSDAVYTAVRAGAEGIPVSGLTARFRWAGGASTSERTLELPEVRLVSPLLQATAVGKAVSQNGDFTLALDIDAQAADVGELSKRLNQSLHLSGGTATARVSLSAPLHHPEATSVSGSVALTDIQILRPIPLLGLSSFNANSLQAKFSSQAGQWQISQLSVDAPALQASFTGQLDSRLVAGDLRLKADRWNAPESLPVAGGAIELSGKLMGETAKPEELAFDGDLQLRGAHAAYRTPKALLIGGELNATVHGEGPFAQPLSWIRSGDMTAAGLVWSGAGVTSLKVRQAKSRFSQDAGIFQFTDADLQAGSARLRGAGQWSPQGHSAEITATANDLKAFGVTLPEAVHIGDYQLVATLRGTPAKALATASGRLQLQDVRLATAKVPEQSLSNVSTLFQFDGERVHLSDLKGSGPAGTLTGNGEWSRSGHALSLAIAGKDFSRLGVVLPEGIHLGGYRLQAELAGAGKQLVSRATGSLRIDDIQFPFGPVAPHHLDRIESELSWDGKRVALSNFTAEGPTGVFTGSGEIADHRFRLALTTPKTNPNLVRWLVPGHLQGGALAGTVKLEGNSSGQIQTASGHFHFQDGAYQAPASMGLLGGSFSVPRLAADYQWERHGEKGRARLNHIVLETALGTGTATLTAADGAGTLTADLLSSDTGQVADRWPVLNAHLRGGAGVGKLQVRFDSIGVRGTLAVNARGGTLMLPGEVSEYAQQPVTTLAGILGFEPGKLTFSDVQVRGPKANLDGSGIWNEGGEVSGTGKAWFSKSYTSKLLKPSGFGWLAKLFGLKEIKSDFILSGTSEQVNLKAGITRGLLWKFAKSQVPKNLQRIAAGQSPLWVKPLVLAEAVTAAPIERLVPVRAPGGGD